MREFHGRRGRCGHQSAMLAVCVLLLVALSSMGVLATPVTKNVIYMIADGTSFTQLEMARVVKGAPLVMDNLTVQSEARNASLDNAATDSAASGTAHATGSRTNNGMLSVTPDGQVLRSVVYLAKAAGLKTGVVTNDALYGATPGAYIANVESRKESGNILEQAIFETQPDVLMGGGLGVYKTIGAAERLGQTGYQFVRTAAELRAWDATSEAKLLGLFAQDSMAYAVDRPESEPTLAEMTRVALEILARDETGFFLMVENDRIDVAGHANDMRRSIYDTLAFDEAVAVALAFAADREDTLVVVTADHETGGLTRAPGNPSVKVLLEGPAAVRSQLTTALAKTPGADLSELLAEHVGDTTIDPFVFQGNYAAFVDALLARVTGFYYTTTGHTDTPVPVFAQGPGAERFLDVEHIADMGQTVIALLGLPGKEERP